MGTPWGYTNEEIHMFDFVRGVIIDSDNWILSCLWKNNVNINKDISENVTPIQ